VALLLGATACGSAGNRSATVAIKAPQKLIAATADATAKAKTARVAVTASMEGGVLPRSMSFDMDGALAFDGSAAEFTMDLSTLVPNAPAGARIEVRMVDGVMYMDFGALIRALDSSGMSGLGNLGDAKDIKWVKLDLHGLTGQSSGNSPSDYTQYLEYLRGVSKDGVHTVGHEQVRGVDTTHYRAEIDLSKSVAAMRQRLDKLSPEMRAGAQNAIDALENRKTPMVADVWIDANGLTRRLDMTIPFPVPGAGSDASMKMRMELYDFGTPVHVQAPPPSEVQDLSSLASGFGGATS